MRAPYTEPQCSIVELDLRYNVLQQTSPGAPGGAGPSPGFGDELTL